MSNVFAGAKIVLFFISQKLSSDFLSCPEIALQKRTVKNSKFMVRRGEGFIRKSLRNGQ
jgi:hypothetical protein